MSFAAAAAAGDAASSNAQFPLLSNECLIKMQMERFEVFKTQDVENGHFDVTFEIEGKKLYANKFILAPVSQTLNSWLSDRWTTKDEPIKIESYTYDIFYQFLCFLYSGSCIMNKENIFALVDVAEFFGVNYLKDLCEKFLCDDLKNMRMSMTFAYAYMPLMTAENVEEMYEFAAKYFMQMFLTSITKFILYNNIEILKTENFVVYKKSFVEFLATIFRDPNLSEKYEISFPQKESQYFESVYKWAEHQILKQKPVVDDENFNFAEAVKIEFHSIIPNPQYSIMKLNFLMNFVLEKGFILSPIELKEFYEVCQSHKVYRNEEDLFKSVYELVEKQALKKQMMAENDDENFNAANSIKADLSEVLSCVKFYEMDETFLMNFIVAKGILTTEEAHRANDILVEVSNNGKTVTGVFKDDIGFREALDIMPYYLRTNGNTSIRFLESKFFLPENPSTVFQTKEIQWYFCLDYSGVLALKHYSVIDENDYLLTGMKEKDGEFQLFRKKQ